MANLYDTNDLESAALCAYKEARGDGLPGMRAVLHCLKNRVGHPGFAHTLHDVIYGKNQFTSMSVPSDPEFNLIPSNSDLMFANALQLAKIVLNTDDPDPTGGAHYYENPKTATSGWFHNVIVADTINHPMTVQIGHQIFYV
jgi:N-acetylmuramoyl-L-alanine amidase